MPSFRQQFLAVVVVCVVPLSACNVKKQVDSGTCSPNPCVESEKGAGRTVCEVSGSSYVCKCNPDFYKEESGACVPTSTSTVELAPEPLEFLDAGATYTARFRVIDGNGNPVPDATVVFQNHYVTTKADGLAEGARSWVYRDNAVRVFHPKFVDAFFPFDFAQAGARTMELRLMPIARTVTLAGPDGGAVTYEGLTLQFPSDSFVTTAGQLVTGGVKVALGFSSVASQPQGLPVAPLEPFTRFANSRISLAAVLSVSLTDEQGAPVQLAEGKGATLSLAFPESSALAAGTFHRIFTLDEDTGLWNFESGCVLQTVGPQLAAQGHKTLCSASLRHFSSIGVEANSPYSAEVALSVTEKLTKATQANDDIKNIYSRILALVTAARNAQDLSASECLADKYTAIEGLRLLADKAHKSLKKYVSAEDMFNNFFVELLQRRDRAIKLEADANSICTSRKVILDAGLPSYSFTARLPVVTNNTRPWSLPVVLKFPGFDDFVDGFGTCTKDVDCGSAESCVAGSCRKALGATCAAPEACSTDKKYQCTGMTCAVNPDFCADRSVCGNGKSCTHNRCVADCQSVGCTAGTVCNATTKACEGASSGTCTSNADCMTGNTCDCATSKCVSTPPAEFCANTAACPGGSSCTRCRCAPSCVDTAMSNPCRAGTICNAITKACEPTPVGYCSAAVPCAPGSFCKSDPALPFSRCEADCTAPTATACSLGVTKCDPVTKSCLPLEVSGVYACSIASAKFLGVPSRYKLIKQERASFRRCTAAEFAANGNTCSPAQSALPGEVKSLASCEMLRMSRTYDKWEARFRLTFGDHVTPGVVVSKFVDVTKAVNVPDVSATASLFLETGGQYCSAEAPETCLSQTAACNADRCVTTSMPIDWADIEPQLVEDADGDTFFAANPKAKALEVGKVDCNDADAKVHPGAEEIACNAVDEDCDGVAVGSSGGVAWSTVKSASEWNLKVCKAPGCAAAASEVGGNAYDENCDGVVSDLDGDHHAAVGDDTPFAGRLGGGDCDDARATVFPGAMEVTNNGRDDNCNGDVDDDGYYSRASWPVAGVALDKFTDCNDYDPGTYPGAPLDAGVREGSFEAFYEFDADAGIARRKADFCDHFTPTGQLKASSRFQLMTDINCDGYFTDLDGDGWTVSGDKSLGNNKDYDCNDLDPRVHPTGTGADGKPAFCMASGGLRNASVCTPDLSNFGGSKQVCQRLPSGYTPRCTDLVDEKSVPWGIFVCSALTERDPLSFTVGELFGACDYGVKLPACKAGLYCSGPLPYSEAFLSYLKTQNAAWDVSKTHWKGMCLPSCGDVCTNNPCTAPHKTKCTVVDRKPSCGCDMGYHPDATGTCVAN